MTKKSLGRLELVDLRDYWKDEARDFTPWIASEEGLELLGEVIGIDLEILKTEARVGPFNADVLAKSIQDELHHVVIENQLGKTDHDHLGKIITYASGLKTKTMVWIASEFTDEHRQALDWLNENAVEGVSYFGLEVSLFRIGDSDPAPQFKLVSSPNDWAKAVQESQSYTITETKLGQKKFWEDLKNYMESKKTFLRLQKPPAQHWYLIAVGRSKFTISLTVNSRSGMAGCEIYFGGENAKRAFDELYSQRATIENELRQPLEWMRLDDKNDCRVIVRRPGGISLPDKRAELLEWFRVTSESFHKVFSPKIRALALPDARTLSQNAPM